MTAGRSALSFFFSHSGDLLRHCFFPSGHKQTFRTECPVWTHPVVTLPGGVEGASVFGMFCPTPLALGDFSCDVNALVERKLVSPAFVMIARFRFTAACVVSFPCLAAVCQ